MPAAVNPLSRLSRSLTNSGLIRPLSLQTGEERSASRLELFFDLAYVLVVAQLADALGKDLSVRGVLVFAGLFTAVWWSWMSSTLYANRFDHDDVLYRLYKLAGMLAVIGMAGAATDATGKYAAAFAACYTLQRLLMVAQYARAYREVPEARVGTRLYLIGTSVGAALWAVSIVVPGPGRYVLWGLGVAAGMVVPILATFAPGDVPLHLEHLPERFALFMILVLGESVAAIAHGVHDASWTAAAVGVAVVSFVLTAALWWSYFDLAGAAAKRLLLEAGGERSSFAHDVFIYGQLPIALALAGVGVGIEHAILESAGEEPSLGTRAVLAGGVALYLAAVSAMNTVMARSWHTAWLLPMLAAAVALADVALALPALVVVGALALLVVAVLVLGVIQEQKGRITVDPL